MPAPDLIEVEVLAASLGVSLDTPEGDDLRRLSAAVSAEIRRLTRRAFEGDGGGSYTETIRLHGASGFTLPHVPVQAVTSIRREAFDGTLETALTSGYWRLEDAARGRIEIRHRGWERARVAWTTTGEIPVDVAQAAADWVASRWEARGIAAGQTGYRTGEDAETWSATHVGRPPADVARVLAGVGHLVGGVV